MEDKKKHPVCLTPLSKEFASKQTVHSASRTTQAKPVFPALLKFRSYLKGPKPDVASKTRTKNTKALGSSPFLHKAAALDNSQSTLPTLTTLHERHRQVLGSVACLSRDLAETQHPHAATLRQLLHFYQDTLAMQAYTEISPRLEASLDVQRRLLDRLNDLSSSQFIFQ